jgi:hypothetical protein
VTPSGEHPLPVHVRGTWGSRALDQNALVTLDATALLVTSESEPTERLVMPLEQLRGAERRDDLLTLSVADGTTVVLSGSSHLDGLRNRLEAAVCTFPAQTLSLRGFGSERSAPGSDHDMWFDALLTARRLAEESRTVETQRRAFDSARLGRHAQQTREAWAAARFEDPADKRALEAELEELAAPYFSALRQLEHAALRLRQAADDVQFATWRRWTATVQRTFRAADDVWMLSLPALADSRGVKGSFWRKLLRRGEQRGRA